MSGDAADVVIVGAGPAGLLLAIELCGAGVTPVVVERLPRISEIPKGNGLVGLSVRVLDYRGLLADLRAGTTYAGPVPGFGFGPLHLDFSPLGASPLHVLAIPQRRLEERLADRLAALGGTVARGHELTGLAQDEGGVALELTGPDGQYRLRTRFVVGCDGAHSVVRKRAGIAFPGVTSDEVSRIGRVILPDSVIDVTSGAVVLAGGALRLEPMRTVMTSRGRYSVAPMSALDSAAPRGAYIVSTWEAADPAGDTGAGDTGAGEAGLTLDELRASAGRVIGADLPMSDPIWLARITGNSRIAESFCRGRVLLAGDAAHLSGLGGSINAGLLDAVNLGWKLAAEIRGRAPDGLLASYQAERMAAARRTLLHTRAQKALSARGEYADALRELFGELLSYPGPLRHVGELIEGSDLRYDLPPYPGSKHPLAGRLVPDVRLQGGTRTADLVRAASMPVLADFTPDGRVVAAAERWRARVPLMICAPLAGAPPADGLLIRPDGYVAWASGPGAADPAAGVTQALSAWCGAAGQAVGETGSGFGTAPP